MPYGASWVLPVNLLKIEPTDSDIFLFKIHSKLTDAFWGGLFISVFSLLFLVLLFCIRMAYGFVRKGR